MTIQHQWPFIEWNTVIAVHTAAATGVVGLGALLLRSPKGTKTHRVLGRAWAGAMVTTSVTSFGIKDAFGMFGFIHGLSVYVLWSVGAGVYHIRRGNVGSHRWHMKCSFNAALAAGALALFMPGRRLFNVAFGVPTKTLWYDPNA